MKQDRNRRERRDRRAIIFSACFAISAVLFFSRVAGAQQQALTPVTDQAAVDRGKALLVEQCGFCHGANARGGRWARSHAVRHRAGRRRREAAGRFLRVGRPDRGCRSSTARRADGRPRGLPALGDHISTPTGGYKILDILVGDPKAGQAYFNGDGRCNSCHSPTGDLKGVGAKYEPTALQGRLLVPRGRPGGSGPPSGPLYMEPTAIKVTVTLPSGESASGGLVRLTDFDVILYDTAAGRVRSFLRNGDVPKVVVTDPLQAHVDHLTKWTDTEMHNMTAYLASLK
jgi:mono/diheme cytochrome c family protein